MFSRKVLLGGLMVACVGMSRAQSDGTPPAVTPDTSAPVARPQGQVLFQSHGEPPPPDADRRVLKPDAQAGDVEVADRERAALLFTAYDLDARVTPITSQLAMRARVTMRNDGAEPLSRVALQISSALMWESVALPEGGKLAFVQHFVDTDVDHTSRANEAVVTLPRALAPGSSVTLDTFYSGAIVQSSERLKRIGATAGKADAADWDAITPSETYLRGFGDVLWYPVAAPPLFLGDGAKLFQAIGQAKLRGAAASMHLRIAVEYRGEPPAEVFFCGRARKLVAVSDDTEAPTATGAGIATAEFAAGSLGFRAMSLMITAEPKAMESESSVELPAVAMVTDNDPGAQRLDEAALPMRAMLEEWLGVRQLSALTVLDHEGQPFEDGPLLVAPIPSLAAPQAADALVHSLTHAWVQTGQPWMDEGLAQFFALQWAERGLGRPAAISKMNDMLQPLAIAEPGFASADEVQKAAPGQPLIAAADEMFYRRKAAAVWWMLHDLAGVEPLRQALQSWREQPVRKDSAREQALAFEKLLEKTSGKDLSWFFNDWVLRDVGLPDLSIADVTPRALPAGKGHDSGWLVAVTVHNDGAATADVPLVIRSGTYSTTKRVRVAGFANVTERVLVEAAPTEVVLNDGGTPEVRSSVHTRAVTIHMQ